MSKKKKKKSVVQNEKLQQVTSVLQQQCHAFTRAPLQHFSTLLSPLRSSHTHLLTLIQRFYISFCHANFGGQKCFHASPLPTHAPTN